MPYRNVRDENDEIITCTREFRLDDCRACLKASFHAHVARLNEKGLRSRYVNGRLRLEVLKNRPTPCGGRNCYCAYASGPEPNEIRSHMSPGPL